MATNLTAKTTMGAEQAADCAPIRGIVTAVPLALACWAVVAAPVVIAVHALLP